MSTSTKVTLEELHRRMGHLAPEAIRNAVKNGCITGVSLDGHSKINNCDTCKHAKMTRKAIRKTRQVPKAERFGDEIHSDVWGPSPTQTLHGQRYYCSFTDDHTRYTKTTLLRTKGEAFDAYKAFEAWANTQYDAKIKRLRSDRGGEFTRMEFDAHLAVKGTERRLTTHDTPEHNGIGKTLNRRLLKKVCAMLHQSHLPKFLWGEAILHA